MFWRISIVFAVWLCAAAAFAKERVWVSSDGRTMTAEFVRELDGDVTFRKDGKLVVIRLEKLSPADQQLVKDLSSGKVTESDSPANNDSASGGDGQTEGTWGKAKKPVVQTRTWTDRFGIKSSGKFVRVDGNDVVISRGNRVLTVPFFNLSENDQQYVRLVLISQGNEDLIPTKATGSSGNRTEDGGNGGGVAGGGVAGGGIGGAGFPGGAIPPGIGGPGMAGSGMAGPGMPGPGIGPGRGMGMPGIAGGAGFPGGGPMRGPGMSSGIGDPAGLPGGGAAALPPGIAGGPMGAGIRGGIGGPGGPGIGRMAPPDLGPGMASAPSGMMPGMASGMGSMPGSSFPSSATAGSSMPPTMMPGMGPASIPPIPEPTFSSPVFEQSFQCSGCGAKISQAESSLSKCPHCGITWGYKQDAFGNKTMTSAGGKLATAGIVILIFVFLGVIVFIALFVGIIVAVVRAAASSARPPQPQRYY